MLHLDGGTLWKQGFALKIYSSTYSAVEGQSFSDLGFAIHKYKYWKLDKKDRETILALCLDQFISGILNFGFPLPFDSIIAVPQNRINSLSLPHELTNLIVGQKQELTNRSQQVIRMRETPSMKSLSTWEQRMKALDGAFKYIPEKNENPKGFLIIDDIFDTGMTLKTIARVVRAACPEVPRYVLALTALKKNY
jgi:predicted amidophosphoribosyltransferase